MSSTNKTTNYELSQYVGADKPTYLGDYNSDMLKIDTQMKNNADNIASVGATATTANATANTALADASTAQTTANNANTSASNASQVATQALSKATANEADITILKDVDESEIGITWESVVTSHSNTNIQRYGKLVIIDLAFNIPQQPIETPVLIATLDKNFIHVSQCVLTEWATNPGTFICALGTTGQIKFNRLDSQMTSGNHYVIGQLIGIIDDSE